MTVPSFHIGNKRGNMLAKIDPYTFIESKLIEAVMLFALWVIFYPIFLYYKNKISNLKIHSTLTLYSKYQEILDRINIDNIRFDATGIYNVGKATAVSDLIEKELELIHASVYSYLNTLLNPDSYKNLEKMAYLYGLSQTELIKNIVTELDNCHYVIDLSQKEILTKHIEVSRPIKDRYIKRYKETLKEDTNIELTIRNSKVEKVLSKYKQLILPYRTMIIKNIIIKNTADVPIDYLINDIINEITISYTVATKTIHHSVNSWNGDLAGITYKGSELHETKKEIL